MQELKRNQERIIGNTQYAIVHDILLPKLCYVDPNGLFIITWGNGLKDCQKCAIEYSLNYVHVICMERIHEINELLANLNYETHKPKDCPARPAMDLDETTLHEQSHIFGTNDKAASDPSLICEYVFEHSIFCTIRAHT
jgi:hypothetical protein